MRRGNINELSGFTFYIVGFLFLALCTVQAHAQTELIINGGFETGDLTGWTDINSAGSSGSWFAYMGNTSPLSAQPILPPPDGDWAATTDQIAPGSHILFQDIEIPKNFIVNCSVIVYYENTNIEFIAPLSLDWDDGPNQQARIDIMDPDAPNFDVETGVLENILHTLPGDPLTLSYTTLNFDLTDFAGTTVRFRAAEVDNQSGFRFSIDNLSCIGIPGPTNVPTLSEWGLMAMAGILGMIGFMAIRRRAAA